MTRWGFKRRYSLSEIKDKIRRAKELKRLYGLSTSQIAQRLGVYPNTLQTWFRKYEGKPLNEI